MRKRLGFPFLFKASETTSTTSWPWPTCVSNLKTISFRSHDENIFKTTNYLDQVVTQCSDSTPDSFLEYDESLLNASQHQVFVNGHESSIETMIRGLGTADRLFFEPGQETSSILEEAIKTGYELPFKESVAVMAMDSRDPFVDFRVSMEEMVETHGLKDWDCLEELLACYLEVNDKSNYGYIIGAFVDLLVNLPFASGSDSHVIDEPSCCRCSSSTTHSFTSPSSFFSSASFISPCLSLDKTTEDEIIEKIVDNASTSSNV